MYVDNIASSNLIYKCNYQHNDWKEEDFIEYIRDQDKFIEKESKQYIESHQEDILLALLKNAARKKKCMSLKIWMTARQKD